MSALEGQLDIPWDARTKARSTDPVTSKAAAAGTGALAAGHYLQIRDALERLGEATPEEIADHVPLLLTHNVGKRLKEMETAGVIEQTGATRAHRNGRSARVWRRARGA